jgi:hypothetical protein
MYNNPVAVGDCYKKIAIICNGICYGCYMHKKWNKKNVTFRPLCFHFTVRYDCREYSARRQFYIVIFLSFLHNAHENDLITLMKCNVSKTLQSTITMKDISKTNSHKCIRLGTLLLALLNLTNSIFFLS